MESLTLSVNILACLFRRTQITAKIPAYNFGTQGV